MHELGIANAVLGAVQTEMLRHPGAAPTKIAMRIGELAAVDEESLRFSFEVITKDTEFAALQLEIEICPRKHRCPQCGEVFVVQEFDFTCPQCGNEKTECVGGDELELAYMEMEEHEPSTAGA
jgi:hydrogenase nickel incorporation protein HypA/HybF